MKMFIVTVILGYNLLLAHEHVHGHQHGHDNGHHGHHHEEYHHGHHEAPHFKYSKQANTQKEAQNQERVHEHHGDSHGHERDATHTYTPPKKEPVFWLEPLLATALISAAPFLILFLVPLDSNKPENQPFLKVLLSFASGGLLGDAFLHLIPHALAPHAHGGEEAHSHSHSHSHGHSPHEGEHVENSHDHTNEMLVGLWVLAGLIAFLVVEKLVRHMKGGHGHSHGPIKAEVNENAEKKENKDNKDKGNAKETESKKEGIYFLLQVIH